MGHAATLVCVGILACRGVSRQGEATRAGSIPSGPTCLALHLSVASDSDSLAQRLVSYVQLDSERVSRDRPELRKVVLADSALAERFQLRVWSADSVAQSLTLTIGNGFGGVQVNLHVGDSTISGTALTFGDVAPRTRSLGVVRGVRVLCKSAQDVSSRTLRRPSASHAM